VIDEMKFGEAVAKTLDRLGKLNERGDLEKYTLSDVLVVASFVKLREDPDEIDEGTMECLIFVDGTTQIPYVQLGLLELAKDTATGVVSEDGEGE
jgi:hypothetical protein